MATSNTSLCVDLDRTLIQTDLLIDTALKLLYQNLLNILRLAI
jgi:hypothetical protein